MAPFLRTCIVFADLRGTHIDVLAFAARGRS